MVMKKNYTLSFDPSVIEDVDRVRGLIPRSAWIEDILRRVIRVVEKTGTESIGYTIVVEALKNPKED